MAQLAKGRRTAMTLAVAASLTSTLASAAEIPPDLALTQREAAAGLADISLAWRSERRSSADPSRIKANFGDPQEFLMPQEQEFESYLCMKYYFTNFYRKVDSALLGDDRAVSFDGDSVFHRIGQADIGRVNPLDKLMANVPDVALLEARYLTFAGYMAKVTPATLRDPIRPAIEALIGDGCVVESVEREAAGRPTWTIAMRRGGDFWTFVTDPSKGHAVVRSEAVAEGGLRTKVTNDDFVRHGESKLWLPRRCRIQWFQPPSEEEPLAVEEVTVQRIGRANPSPSRYALQFDPGTLVSDFRIRPGGDATSDQITYVVTARLGDLDRVARDARNSVQPTWRRWLAPGSAAVIVLSIAFVHRFWRPGRSE